MAIADELIAILGYRIEGEDAARRYQQQLDRINGRLNKFAQAAGRFAGIAAGAMATGMGLLGRSVINTSAQFETYQATLETIEGSAEAARQSLDWISDFGKTTPYDVAQVTEAFVALKAYGIDPIANDALRTLGDTAAAMGKPLNQAVEAFADAATFEFERLKEFGIRAQQQGDEVTFTWTKNGQQMSETVKKNSEDVRRFLLETMGDRFGGAMDRQSRTFRGITSNIGDTWTDFQRRVGEAGFFDNVKGKLQGFLDTLNRLDEDGTLDRWAANTSAVLSGIADFFGAITERIGENVMFIIEHWEHLQTPALILAGLFALIVARAFPLMTVLGFLALAVDDFLAYLQGGESIIGDFIAKIQELTGVSDGVAQAIAGLGGAVLSALGLAFLFAPGKVLKLFGKLLVGGIVRLAPLVAGAVGLLFTPAGLIAAAVAAAGLLVWYFWDELKAAWEWLSGQVGELAQKLGTWFQNASWGEIFAAVASPLMYIFWDEIKAAFDATVSRATEIFSGIKDYILNIDWAGVGLGIMNAIWDGMKALGAEIQAWFLSIIPEWARDFIVGDEGPGAQAPAQPGPVQGPPASQPDRRLPAGQVGSVPLTEDALDYKLEMQRQEWERVTGNLEGNIARMAGSEPINATITDARTDARQFPFESNVTVNQTVNQAVDAPGAAARATAGAVSSTVASQRSQIEAEPSMQ